MRKAQREEAKAREIGERERKVEGRKREGERGVEGEGRMCRSKRSFY